MADLTSTIVAANYRKIAPTSQLGTPELKFVSVAAVHNTAAVDFTKAVLAGTGTFADAGSLLAKAVNALQGFAEVYVIGTPSATEFVCVVHANTANDGVTGWSSAEAAILAAIGADTSVTITELTLTGDTLA